MTPDDIADSYNKLAGYWAGEEFNRENGIAQHERALRFLNGAGKAIDIGCGSSGRIIDLLLSRGFDVEGLDISPEMIRLARAKHPNLTFYQADICEWKLPYKYDFISAWDSIWHVPLGKQEAVLRKLCDGLSDGGVLIFTTGGVDLPDERTNPCMGQPLYHAAPGVSAVLDIISSAGCVCRHLEYDQLPEVHVYLIVQKLKLDSSVI